MCEIVVRHMAGCLQYSAEANREGLHTVALGLARQVVEALTVIEVGFLAASGRPLLLEGWLSDEASLGSLRKRLAREAWPAYGTGLWAETWTDFFGNLAMAVQPYAHCTNDLMQWGLSIRHCPRPEPGLDEMTMIAAAGAYDPEKASRLTLLDATCVWTLGRLCSQYGDTAHDLELELMRSSIAESRLLDPGSDWGRQLIPHQWFYD